MSHPGLNVVFTGFSYPRGMAGTKRNQHMMEVLRTYHDVTVRVISLRPSTAINPLCGVHEGVPYETIGPDLSPWRLLLRSPVFFGQTCRAIRRAARPGAKNILMVYGSPKFDNVPMIWEARRCGYKVVFDFSEDDATSDRASLSHWQKCTVFGSRVLTNHICRMADGIVVISSHLERKLRNLTKELVPIHMRPISVDGHKIVYSAPWQNRTVALFYAGSFGVKDGVENLLDAFSQLAPSHQDLGLVLTGAGEARRMRDLLNRLEASPFRDRIAYKGYLDDDAYHVILQSVDIPCMTRADCPQAHAGFPFKLGEFLATGKPVVASAVSDVAKFISHREDALLVRPGSVDDIVSAVDYLLRNRDEAVRMGIRGRQRALEHFDSEAQAKNFYEFLRTIAGDL